MSEVFPGSTPNLDKAEIITPDTVNSILLQVSTMVGDRPLQHDERAGMFTALDGDGQPMNLSVRQLPIEANGSGPTATIFVRERGEWVLPALAIATQWRFYPTAKGTEVVKSSPIEAEYMPKQEAEDFNERMANIYAFEHDIREKERAAGYAVAYEHEGQELLSMLREAEPQRHEPPAKEQTWFRGLFKRIGL